MRLEADNENWSACVDAPSGGERKLISLRGWSGQWKMSACVDAPSGGQRKLISLRGCAFRRIAKTDKPTWMRLQANSGNWSACVDAPSGGQRKLISLRGCVFKRIANTDHLRGCAFRRIAKTDQPTWIRLEANSENWSAFVDAPSDG